jgi:L-asparaginase II
MISLRSGVALVDVQRSGVVESLHSGHLVLLDRDGAVLAALGDVTQPVFARSSNKPLQAVGMLRAGLDLPPPWLALAAASHSGEPVHLEGVTAMLAAAGLDESNLRCPADWPLGEQAREDVIAGGGRRRPLAMNCSGKHAAMLLTCVANGWSTADYLDPDHPLQRALHSTVEELSGEPIRSTGVDGCGAPVFAFGLTGLARAFGRLARAGSGPEHLVAQALRAHPLLVGGTGRSVSLLMAAIPGLIAKDGAEGVYAAALPDGSALAVKIDDGALRGAEPVVVAALERLGAHSAELGALAAPVLLGGGRPVGSVHVRPGLF